MTVDSPPQIQNVPGAAAAMRRAKVRPRSAALPENSPRPERTASRPQLRARWRAATRA